MWVIIVRIVVVLVGIVGLCSLAYLLGKRKVILAKQEESEQIECAFRNVSKVEQLLTLYMGIVLEHGPDSGEATAFRFGCDNPSHGLSNPEMVAFKMFLDIVDKSLRERINN